MSVCWGGHVSEQSLLLIAMASRTEPHVLQHTTPHLSVDDQQLGRLDREGLQARCGLCAICLTPLMYANWYISIKVYWVWLNSLKVELWPRKSMLPVSTAWGIQKSKPQERQTIDHVCKNLCMLFSFFLCLSFLNFNPFICFKNLYFFQNIKLSIIMYIWHKIRKKN